MSNREVSSLDRFVTTRGPVLAGVVDETRRLRVLAILSMVYGILGAGFLALAAVPGSPALPFAINGGLWLATSGLMGGIRLWLKSRLKPEHTTHAELTADARELLCDLMAHILGWPFGRRRRRRLLRRAMRRGTPDPTRSQRCEDVLTPEAFRLLESAAFQYNRIFGVVGARGTDAGGRLGPEILAAADQTMAQLLDAAALVNHLPENAPRLEAELQARVRELAELAAEVERLQSASAASPALAEGASPVRRVLEELRADQRAREELRRSQPEPEAQRIELRSGGEE